MKLDGIMGYFVVVRQPENGKMDFRLPNDGWDGLLGTPQSYTRFVFFHRDNVWISVIAA